MKEDFHRDRTMAKTMTILNSLRQRCSQGFYKKKGAARFRSNRAIKDTSGEERKDYPGTRHHAFKGLEAVKTFLEK